MSLLRSPVGRLAVVLGAALFSATCGSSPSPTTPATTNGVAVPTGFNIVQQQVTFLNNVVQTSWSGSASTYTFQAGTSPGGSDIFTADVSGTSYTWNAPRDTNVYYIRVLAKQGTQSSTASNELPVYTIDMRDVIDALFFRSGPMADVPSTALSNPQAGVWADGTNLSLIVSNEAGAAARANGDTFTAAYATLSSRGITASSSMTSDDLHSATLNTVANNTIITRVLTGFCGIDTVIACAYYGPSPIGVNRSIATINRAGGDDAIAHELGHAYGMGHVHVTAALRPELNFLMNPALVSTQMTQPEKLAISTALAAGVRGGWTRDQALGAGLVRPYTASASLTAGQLLVRGFDMSRCGIIDGHDLPGGLGIIR